MRTLELNFDHLLAMSDSRGVFEHALLEAPRVEHGYCVDDVARALVVLERAGLYRPELEELAGVCRRFIADAQTGDGKFINRCDVNGLWHGIPEVRDHWGRALWALGTAVRNDPVAAVRAECLAMFERSAALRSPFLRSMMFAALGAAEVLVYERENESARSLLLDAVAMIPPVQDMLWPWPEPRLTYANAVIPEVLLLAGQRLDDADLVRDGVLRLGWLVFIETRKSHWSPTPTGGWDTSMERPMFDQQPIEVAALVDACATAFDATRDPRWLPLIQRGIDWFDGVNDSHVRMFDPRTGGGYDGLKMHGRNDNEGAESTLCYLSVMQRGIEYLGGAR